MKKKHVSALLLIIVLVLHFSTGCTTEQTVSETEETPAPQTEAIRQPEPEPAEEIIEPPAEEEPAPEPEPEITYILNKNTKKFHKPACRSAKQISPKNYEESCAAREDVIAQGYSPCGNCKP